MTSTQFIGSLGEGDRVNVVMPDGTVHERIITSVGCDNEGCEQIVFSAPETRCHEEAKWRHA